MKSVETRATRERHRANRISTGSDAQDLTRKLERLEVKVLTKGDYKGRLPFPVFSTVTPLAPESIVPTAISLTEEKRGDWHSPKAAREILGQGMDWRSPFMRLITTMLNQPGAESEEGFRILREDLARFRPEPAIFNDSRFEEWWFKFLLALQIRNLTTFRMAFDHGETSKEAKNLLEIIEGQMEVFKATLTGLELKDLPSYLRFADLYAQSRAVTQGGHSQSFVKNGGHKSTLARLILPRLEEMQRQRETLEESLDEEDRRTWARLKTGWGWKEIQDVLVILPMLGSRFVIAHAIAALEANLGNLLPQKVADEIKIEPARLAFLLSWNEKTILEEDKTIERYSPLFELSRQTVKLPGVLVLGEHLPIVAMTLLDKARQIYSRDGFRKLIGDVHALAQLKQKLTTPWFLTLLSLKDDPEIKDFVDELLTKWENLPEEVRDVLLNKKAGELTLSPQGKLRVKAEHIPPSPESLEAYPKPPEKKRENKALEVREVLVLPFLGEVGLIEGEQTKSLLLSSNGIPTSEDQLLEDFTNLVRHWKDPFRRERHLLYFSQLNLPDERLCQVKKLFGIEAVFIEGGNFVFVLEKGRAYAQVNARELPAGFQGRLDEIGQLHILGMDDSFLGEPEQLFLNNLALRLTTQSFYTWGADKERDHEVQRAAHEIIAGWNRSGRNSLPKIELNSGQNNQGNFRLPIRLDGYKEPVLVCELPK